MKSRFTKRRLAVAAAAICLVLLFARPGAIRSERATGPDPAYAELLTRIHENRVLTEDITAALNSVLARSENRLSDQISYSELTAYLERCNHALEAHFPAGVFRMNRDPLASFDGAAALGSRDVYVLPFVPIIPENYLQKKELRYTKLHFELQGRSVYGLRVDADTLEEIREKQRQRNPVPAAALPYLDDLTARLHGFTHAQLMLDLSENVMTGPFFDYNGIHPWDQHARYREKDQVSRPIALTNVAHLAGARYNISDHPDFALKIPMPAAKPAIMTFFLWRRDAKELAQSDPIVPDFVFQLVIHP